MKSGVLLKPKFVEGLPDGLLATHISAGSGFSLVLMEDKKVYSWGNNTQGACGHGDGASLIV